ncbi:MAG TPA: FHA domain-containing protein [Thermoanaerobaculia bacterium]|nr:FHA domain-containing protein [Thermoanaerobaculia bacterium]
MPTVSFLAPDGEETPHRLDPGRAVRIGRDSDNEIVLRDPRVSRHHARIVFEKGFFVIYDLASANGTIVNGKRVSIAPLVDGAVIRLGSCTGRFSDTTAERAPEPPTEATALPSAPPAAEPATDEGPATTNPYPLARPDNDTEPRSIADLPGDQFRIELDPRGPQTVKNGSDDPVLYFELPPRLVGWVGRLVASMVAVSGITAAAILAAQGRVGPLAGALVLTAAFVALIVFLIPPNEIYLCRDPAMLQVDLVVRQRRRLPIAASEYATEDGQGVPLAQFRKNSWTSLGRRRWWIVTPASMVIGWAEEDSLPRALARKVAGHAVRALRSNYRFVFEGEFVGRLERRDQDNVVDLAPDASRRFDRRIALPLSVLIVAVEGK